MGQMNMRDEDQVKTRIEQWAKAIGARDRAGILARHAPDMLMFDLPAPVVEAYDRTWDFFFAKFVGPHQCRAARSAGDRR